MRSDRYLVSYLIHKTVEISSRLLDDRSTARGFKTRQSIVNHEITIGEKKRKIFVTDMTKNVGSIACKKLKFLLKEGFRKLYIKIKQEQPQFYPR